MAKKSNNPVVDAFSDLQGSPLKEDTRPAEASMPDYPVMHDTDNGIFVDKDSWVVIWSPRKGWFFGSPNNFKGKLPVEGEALMATYVRLDHDPAFRREMRDWLKSQKT